MKVLINNGKRQIKFHFRDSKVQKDLKDNASDVFHEDKLSQFLHLSCRYTSFKEKLTFLLLSDALNPASHLMCGSRFSSALTGEIIIYIL